MQILILKMFLILGQLESGNVDDIVSDSGREFGRYQLTLAYIEDANKLYDTDYKVSDAYDKDKAERIILLYAYYWCKKRNIPYTLENIVRLHRMGCNQYLSDKATKRWDKVRKKLDI